MPRYEGLVKLIDSLKEQLIAEKREKVAMESEIRTELCDEFNKMMVQIESGWERRLQGGNSSTAGTRSLTSRAR